MTGPDSALTQAARCHARRLLSLQPRHKSPAGEERKKNESQSVGAGRTSWRRRHLTSRRPVPGVHADTAERLESRKMRRGGGGGGWTRRSLISLLLLAPAAREVKGHRMYLREFSRGTEGAGETIPDGVLAARRQRTQQTHHLDVSEAERERGRGERQTDREEREGRRERQTDREERGKRGQGEWRDTREGRERRKRRE